jgi:hypothetical protein
MSGADDISRREANCRTLLEGMGLALRKSGDGYQVVNAGTPEPAAGQQGLDEDPMSLREVEDLTALALFWPKGRVGGRAQPYDSLDEGLPEGTMLLFQDPPRTYFRTAESGPRVKAVIDTPTLRETLLEKCEHLSGDENFSLWTSTRPSMLLCGACYKAAQTTDERRCAFCNEPVEVPERDFEVATKATDRLGVHFYLCSHCMDLDGADSSSV